MKKSFFVLIERDEDGYYAAVVPELQGCHTQAATIDELLERTKEVFRHDDGRTTTVPYYKGEELRIGIVLDIPKKHQDRKNNL